MHPLLKHFMDLYIDKVRELFEDNKKGTEPKNSVPSMERVTRLELANAPHKSCAFAGAPHLRD